MDWLALLEVVSEHLWALFAALFLYFVRAGAKWVVEWVVENIKKEYAIMAVELAETAWGLVDGPQKFEEATKWLSAKLAKKNIKVDADEIGELVEQAVFEVKEQWPYKD